jgi:hypothetical protein
MVGGKGISSPKSLHSYLRLNRYRKENQGHVGGNLKKKHEITLPQKHGITREGKSSFNIQGKR